MCKNSKSINTPVLLRALIDELIHSSAAVILKVVLY